MVSDVTCESIQAAEANHGHTLSEILAKGNKIDKLVTQEYKELTNLPTEQDLLSSNRFVWDLTTDTEFPFFDFSQIPETSEWFFDIYLNGFALSINAGWSGFTVDSVSSKANMVRMTIINNKKQILVCSNYTFN